METNRVYVGNLAYSVYWYDLKDFMRSAGEVVHANVLRSPNGQSRGYGIVEFASPEDAQRAVDTLNNVQLKGRPVFIREDRETQHGSGPSSFNNGASNTASASTSSNGAQSSAQQSQDHSETGSNSASNSSNNASSTASASASAGESNNKQGVAVFVGNLPFAVNWQQLKQLFSAVGEVVRADIHVTPQRRSRGHGTVVLADEATAQEAIKRFNGYKLEGRIIEVREDKPASERSAAFLWCSSHGEPSDVVYVSNLPWSTTDADLVELFQSIAPLSRAQLQNFPDGRFSGCGVVRFESASSAEQAIAQLDGYNYGSRDLHLSYARYPPAPTQSS